MQNSSLSQAPTLPSERRGPWVKVHPELPSKGKGALATVIAVQAAHHEVVAVDEDLIAWMKEHIPNLGADVRSLQRYRANAKGLLSYIRTPEEGVVYTLHCIIDDKKGETREERSERDGKKEEKVRYLRVPVAVVEHQLSDAALRLDARLRYYHHEKPGGAFPGVKRLAGDTVMSVAEVKRARRELRDKGLWSWEQRKKGPRRTCHYTPHLLPLEVEDAPAHTDDTPEPIHEDLVREVDDNGRDTPDPQSRAILTSLNFKLPPTPSTVEAEPQDLPEGKGFEISPSSNSTEKAPRSQRRRGHRSRSARPSAPLAPISEYALRIFREEWIRQSKGEFPRLHQERLLLKAASQMARHLEELTASERVTHLGGRLREASTDVQVRALLRFMIQGLFLSKDRKPDDVAISPMCLFPREKYLDHRFKDAKQAQTTRDLEDWDPARDGEPADPRNQRRYLDYLNRQEKEQERAEKRRQAVPYLELARADRDVLETRIEEFRDRLKTPFGRAGARGWLFPEGALLARATQVGLDVADLQSTYRRLLEQADEHRVTHILDDWRLCRKLGEEPIVCPDLVARAHALGVPCEWTVPEPPSREERERRQRIAARARILEKVSEADIAGIVAQQQREVPLDVEALDEIASRLSRSRRAAFRAGLAGLALAIEEPLPRCA